MGLLSILKKLKQKEKQMRILILGLDNAGKTTILKQVNGEPIDKISPTLGFNIKSFEHNEYTLNIWDVGGQKTIRSFWRNYFEETDGLIWVVDCTDRERLNDCRDELHILLQQDKLSGVSLLVFANKQDLTNSINEEQIKEILELNTPVFKNRSVQIIPCSAFTGQGLVQGFDWIVGDISSRIFIAD